MSSNSTFLSKWNFTTKIHNKQIHMSAPGWLSVTFSVFLPISVLRNFLLSFSTLFTPTTFLPNVLFNPKYLRPQLQTMPIFQNLFYKFLKFHKKFVTFLKRFLKVSRISSKVFLRNFMWNTRNFDKRSVKLKKLVK